MDRLSKFFALDSPLMEALRKLADIMFCNIAFCICSLPVFTAGAALSALYDCVWSIMEETEDSIILRQFWRALRKNFKQATLLWLICLAAFAFLGAYYVVTGMLAGALSRVYRVTFFLLAILFLFGFQYLFPLQSHFRMKLGELLPTAWRLSMTALPWTLLSLLVPALAVYFSFFLNPSLYNLAVFFWFALLFGVVAYLNCFFFRMAFRQLRTASEE